MLGRVGGPHCLNSSTLLKIPKHKMCEMFQTIHMYFVWGARQALRTKTVYHVSKWLVGPADKRSLYMSTYLDFADLPPPQTLNLLRYVQSCSNMLKPLKLIKTFSLPSEPHIFKYAIHLEYLTYVLTCLKCWTWSTWLNCFICLGSWGSASSATLNMLSTFHIFVRPGGPTISKLLKAF